MNTVNHRQNAKEIGGTDSTPPLATIVFVAKKLAELTKVNKERKSYFLSMKAS